MTLKKMLVLAPLALGFCHHATAQQVKLTFEDAKVKRGSAFQMNLLMENDIDVLSIEFELTLPEGVIFQASKGGVFNEERLGQKEDEWGDIILTKASTEVSNATKRVVIMNSNNIPFVGNSGVLVTMYFRATASAALQDIELTIKDQVVSYDKGDGTFDKVKPENTTSRLTVYDEGSFSIGSEGYATFYCADAYVMPEGVEGGVVTGVADAKATVDYQFQGGDVVPAKTPLLLKGNAQTCTIELVGSDAVAPMGNLLHGADAVDADGKTFVEGTDVKYYILSHSADGTNFGFYWAADNGGAVTYQSPFAFMAVDGTESLARHISLDPTTTGLHKIDDKQPATLYTLDGIKVDNRQRALKKGVYVRGGKKIVIK